MALPPNETTTLAKPYHYIAEILNAEDDRVDVIKHFKTPAHVHDWAVAYLAQHSEAFRIQLWFGGTDIDNPNIDRDWVNSYAREPFVEFGRESVVITRATKVTRIETNGKKYVNFETLPPVYALHGNWSKVTTRNGGKQKKSKRLNPEEISA